jgi:iron complex outermembrane recepter protein
MALFGESAALHAQQVVQPPGDGALPAQATSADQASKPGDLQEVVVTGIRYSMEQSIAQKRAATNVTEVVTAEDIGKMPDKNIADALQRLPGVNISSMSGSEGGFDEADRVSCRGTNPSLAQTTIDGHMVASGDWFVLDQSTTVGRSVSYTLLPAELVKEVVVNMSPEAKYLEGGVACNVDIHTRNPLDFQKATTLEASAGAVYADLPATTDPQFNALGNWLNDSHSLGVMLQLFYEQRHEQRQGQELLGYSQISPTSPMAVANPNLANVWYPDLIGSAFFQQERKRSGGLLKIEWQANDNVLLDASGFLSKLEATNVNDNYLFWGSNIINGGAGEAPSPGYVVQNGTLTSATFAPQAGVNYSVYDQISRPGEGSNTNFGNLDIHITASDHLKFLGQLGVTTGHGLTPTQDVSETVPSQGTGAGYTLNGITSAANWNLGSTINTTPTPGGVPVAFSWIFGDQNTDVLDKETYGKIDGTFSLDNSAFTDFQFGARYADHQRHMWGAIGQGPNFAVPGSTSGANYPTGYLNYPAAFGNGLGGVFPNDPWYWTPGQLAAYDDAFANRDPIGRADWASDYGLEEKDTAVYFQADFKGSNWSGNLGLRFVQTKESVVQNVGVTLPPAPAPVPPGVIATSAFGPYEQVTTDNTYNDFLPSANLKWDISPDLVGRFAASQTMARPDYSALASSTALGAPPPTPTSPPGSATGSNPNLKPVISTGLDAGLEWYFAPKSLLAVSAFYMNLHDYISYGTVNATYTNFNATYPNGFPAPYLVTVPVNANGRVDGFEVNYQQPITENFGIQANYTYADGVQTSQVTAGGTGDTLVGTSKNTYNVLAYYETAKFTARVAWNFRSAFFDGLDRNTAFFQNDIGTLAASLGYAVNDQFTITLDGLNLNNPTLKYYALNEDQPRAFYKNGSQYYLNLRFKF